MVYIDTMTLGFRGMLSPSTLFCKNKIYIHVYITTNTENNNKY